VEKMCGNSGHGLQHATACTGLEPSLMIVSWLFSVSDSDLEAGDPCTPCLCFKSCVSSREERRLKRDGDLGQRMP